MAKLVATEPAQQVIDQRGAAARRPRRRRRRAGRAALSRDSRAAHLRGHERDPEAGHRRAGAAVTRSIPGATSALRRSRSSWIGCRRRISGRGWTGPRVPELRYPDRLNATAVLLDHWIESRPRRSQRAAPCQWRVDLPAAPRHRQSHRRRAGRRPRPGAGRPRAAARRQPSDARRLLVRRAQGRRRGGDHDAAAPARGSWARSSSGPRCDSR